MKRFAFFLALCLASAHAAASWAAAVIHEFVGDSNEDRLGQSVASVPDLDGDAVSDLVVGAPFDDDNGTSSGSTRVFSGDTGTVIRTLHGASGDRFGWSVSGVGDVNGDGAGDVIVGARLGGTLGGAVYVFSGTSGSQLHFFDGTESLDRLGESVADASDVNGDQVPDIIAGAPQNSVSSPGPGYARVYSGSTGAILHTFVGDESGDFLGSSVAGIGDVNGDSRGDVVVGAIRSTGGLPGYARVFSGLDGAVLFTFTGDYALDAFGVSVAGAGDANDDGIPDVIVGATRATTGAGYARVFSGADGAVLHTFTGDIPTDRFGNSVAGVGDMDGDGHDDVIVGAPNPNIIIPVAPVAPAARRAKSNQPGYARVFSGRTGEVLLDLPSVVSDDGFGVSVAGARDVNGDAVPDVVVGAWQDQNGLPGFARVYAGERPAPPGCAPVRGAASALGAAAFAAAAGILATLGRRKNLSPRERSARSAG